MPDISELEIPDIVQDYLEPFSGDSPVGIDATNEEEYFVLNMEIPKTSPDYKKCIELSAVILKEKSKDIKIATWLCFALFRTEKIKGLVNGLKIIYHLLKKYENNLYPANPNYRSKAIQFLNQPRFYKLVEKESVSTSNAKDFIEADIVLNSIIAECSQLFPKNVPVLKFIVEVMQTHAENAQDLLTPPKEKAPIPSVQSPVEKKVEVVEKPVVENAAPAKVVEKSVQQAPPVKEEAQPIKLGTEKHVIIQLRQI